MEVLLKIKGEWFCLQSYPVGVTIKSSFNQMWWRLGWGNLVDGLELIAVVSEFLMRKDMKEIRIFCVNETRGREKIMGVFVGFL